MPKKFDRPSRKNESWGYLEMTIVNVSSENQLVHFQVDLFINTFMINAGNSKMGTFVK